MSLSLLSITVRKLRNSRLLLLWGRPDPGSSRSLFSGSTLLSGQWKKETPLGGQTEVYVYNNQSQTVWPDPKLGVFSPTDPKFSLPGLVGVTLDAEPSAEDITEKTEPHPQPIHPNQTSDLLSRPTSSENQVQVLYSAHDYIQYTDEAERVVCADILDEFPRLDGMNHFSCELHEAPRLLRYEFWLNYMNNNSLDLC